MLPLLSALGSLISVRVRSRASPELELVALRHQLTVLRRQRPGTGRSRLGKSIPWPDDVWRRAGRQILVPRQQLLIHRPRHVGQDARPIHKRPCPTQTQRRHHKPSAKSDQTISGTAMLTPLGRWASGRSSFLTERITLYQTFERLYRYLGDSTLVSYYCTKRPCFSASSTLDHKLESIVCTGNQAIHFN